MQVSVVYSSAAPLALVTMRFVKVLRVVPFVAHLGAPTFSAARALQEALFVSFGSVTRCTSHARGGSSGGKHSTRR